ncbi:MAG: hypothetical protein GAK41_00789 [Burkholderia gladioli]|nr:MAG: hypothetical protein GAK41_00789 [Burkholderia gladioli]
MPLNPDIARVLDMIERTRQPSVELKSNLVYRVSA